MILFVVAGINSCKKDNLEELLSEGNGQAICDVDFTLSYQNDIIPILSANCYQCHAANVAPFLASGNVLDNYNSLKIYANDGRLVSVINHKPGFPEMPQGAEKLSDCTISRIETWVNQGTLNN